MNFLCTSINTRTPFFGSYFSVNIQAPSTSDSLFIYNILHTSGFILSLHFFNIISQIFS